MSTQNNTSKSVYRRGAEDGLVLGIYLSVLLLASMLTVSYPMLSVVALVMMAGVPVVVYRMLSRGIASGAAVSRFSATWMHGISVFFFGALLMGVTMYVYLRFIDPQYIITNIRQTIHVLTLDGGEQSLDMARRLAYMIDHHKIPSAIQCVFALMWAVVFSGTMLSMILTAIATAMAGRRERSRKPENSGGNVVS